MWAPLLCEVLLDFPEVKIVLSTSWARELSFSRARDWLPVDLRGLVVGATWHSAMAAPLAGFRMQLTWWDQATRYQQIKRYAGRAGLSDWVAVDDQPEGWAVEDQDKLVHTDGIHGLSDPRARALLVLRLKNIRKAGAY